MGTCLSIVEDILAASQAEQGQGSSAGGGGGAAPSSSYSSGGVSPVYSQLPSGAEEHPVRNVYDGDTLTLKDERRVRFLGVDTPELKEKQPFAQEAKDYTKSRCSDSVYLKIEGKDHYDRLLAWVFVKSGGGYLCVNEGL
ncbi:MAG: hypothetical protein SGARI_008003, partial [Bacillariaceae sp.]